MPKGDRVFKRDFFHLPKKVQSKIIRASMEKLSVDKYLGILDSVDDVGKLEILKRNNYEVLLHFASRGKIDKIVPILEYLGEGLYEFLKTDSYSFIRSLAQFAKVELLDKYIGYLEESEVVRATSCIDYDVLKSLAFLGEDRSFIKYISNLQQRNAKGFLTSDRFYVIQKTATACAENREEFYCIKASLPKRKAAEMGEFDAKPYISIIRYMLSQLIPESQIKALESNKFLLIKEIAKIGDLDLLFEVLDNFSDPKVPRILKSNNYEIIKTISKSMDLDDIVSVFGRLDKESIGCALTSSENSILIDIVNRDGLEALKKLLKLCGTDIVKRILSSDSNHFLKIIASNDEYIDLLEEYLSLFDKEELDMILSEGEFSIPRRIATHSHSDHLLKITEFMTEERKQDMLLSKRFAILRNVSDREEWATVSTMLEFIRSHKQEAIRTLSRSLSRTTEELEDLISGSSDDSSIGTVGEVWEL